MGERFATTRWSLVMAAGQRGSAEAEQALASLCEMYWYPVFAFVRRMGHSVDEAQDLTQGFFTRLIEKSYLEDADRDRGRFRAFLLTACRRFVLDEHDRATALKRGGGAKTFSIDVEGAEQRYQRALAHEDTPERFFERQWCLTLLDSVLEDLRNDYVASENERLFDRLSPFLTMADDAGTHAEAGRDLGMQPGAVKVAVHRLRAKYRDAFRNRVSETVGDGRDVDDELRHLLETFRNL